MTILATTTINGASVRANRLNGEFFLEYQPRGENGNLCWLYFFRARNGDADVWEVWAPTKEEAAGIVNCDVRPAFRPDPFGWSETEITVAKAKLDVAWTRDVAAKFAPTLLAAE